MKHSLQKRWFDLIKSGVKTLEGRIRKGNWLNVDAGDVLVFYCENDEVTCVVEELTEYASFEEMLSNVNLGSILPGIDSVEEGLKIYESIYGKECPTRRRNGFATPTVICLRLSLVIKK